MKKQSNKVAIITGSTRGIGRATAIKLSEKGIRIVASYLKEDTLARTLKLQIEKRGGVCTFVKGNIGQRETLESILDVTLNSYGSIDYLVNNVGLYSRRKLEDISEKDFMESVYLNLYVPFNLCQLVAPIMMKKKYGKIVNVSTVLALRGYDYSSHYISAKAGLIGLTKSLARELSPHITVNCVVPGFIETSLIKKDSKEKRARRLKDVPLKRLGTAEEVAGVISFLLSGEADYVTGEILNVSGGYHI